VMKSLGTSGSATRRVFSYKVGGTLEEICLEQVLWTWGSATMIGTPDEGRCMNGTRFIRDDTTRIEVPDLIRLFCFCRVVFPLDLSIFESCHTGQKIGNLCFKRFVLCLLGLELTIHLL
jgi:hypothetical protein